MKRLLLIFSVVAITMFVLNGCDKENGSSIGNGGSGNNNGGSGGTSVSTGILKLSSTSDNPYYVYIDGNYQTTIAGHGTYSWKLNTGSYTVRVLQKSGYLFYPTDETYNCVITKNNTNILYFPKTKNTDN